jgi:hypothetical protein
MVFRYLDQASREGISEAGMILLQSEAVGSIGSNFTFLLHCRSQTAVYLDSPENQANYNQPTHVNSSVESNLCPRSGKVWRFPIGT